MRSSNHTTKGVFDGSATVSVQVQPKSANISVAVNGEKLDNRTINKFGTQEARKGLVFDASASIPM